MSNELETQALEDSGRKRVVPLKEGNRKRSN